MTMLSEVYVDNVEEKRIVAIRPKPAFRALFEIATTRKVKRCRFDLRGPERATA